MPAPDPIGDRNLLFGISALQSGVITESQLLDAIKQWTNDKEKSLGQILIEQSVLSQQQVNAIEPMVEAQLKLHQDDSEQSLRLMETVYHTLNHSIDDTELQQTLELVRSGSNAQAETPTPTQNQIASHRNHSRYSVIRPHAKGGLGEVFVAHDQELNREVALKEIQPKYAGDIESRNRFILEAEVTGGLEHPGIVPVYGLGSYEDGVPYYAMRFIEGESLQASIKQFHSTKMTESERTIAIRKLLGRFVDVCDAIGYAHSRGVLHRDIKPANIMMGKFGETLVVDWGLAKVSGRNEIEQSNTSEQTLQISSGSNVTPTVLGTAIGTPAYMPPEQASGNLSDFSPSSDVYSLGATLFHLLTGQAPFTGRDAKSIIQEIFAGEIPFPSQIDSGIPIALNAICRKAMSFKSADRYQSTAELAADIESYLADEPVAAMSEPVSVKVRRWLRKHPALVTSTAATLLIGTISLLVFSTIVSGVNSRLEQANLDLDHTNQQLDKSNQDLKTSVASESAAKKLALENENRAKQNAKSAQEQGQLALETLNSVIFDVQGSLRKLSGAGEVRRRLLQTSLEQLEKVSKKFVGNVTVDRDTANALDDLGDLAIRFSNNEDDNRVGSGDANGQTHGVNLAMTYYKESLNIRQQLAQIHPEDPTLQRHLSASYGKLGRLHLRNGKVTDAMDEFKQSFEILKTIDARWEHRQIKRDLSIVLTDIAGVYLRMGKITDAFAEYQKAMSIRKQLAAKYPGENWTQTDLAGIHEDISSVLIKMGKTKEAYNEILRSVKIREESAEADLENSTAQIQLALTYRKLANSLLEMGKITESSTLRKKSLEIIKQLYAADSDDESLQRDLIVAHQLVGEVQDQMGSLPDALVEFQKSLELAKRLASSDLNDLRAQRSLAIAYGKVGDTLLKKGEITKASEAYRKGLESETRYALSDPNDFQTQRDLSVSHSNMGEIFLKMRKTSEALLEFQKSLAIRQKLADADPANVQAKLDLIQSHTDYGGLLWKSGKVTESLAEHKKGLAHCEKLVESTPENVNAITALAHNQMNVGSMLFQIGRADEALTHFLKGQKIIESLTAKEPNDALLKHDLSIVYARLGEAYQIKRQFEKSELIYQKALKIGNQLLKSDPSNAKLKRHVFGIHESAGRMFDGKGDREQSAFHYRQALQISKELARSDPNDVQAQIDLSIGHNRLGEILLRMGKASNALAEFQSGLEIRQKLAGSAPNDLRAQRNLSISHEKMGIAFLALKKHPKALESFKTCLDINEQILKLSPDDALAKRGKSVTHIFTGNALFDTGKTSDALSEYQKSLTIRQEMAKSNTPHHRQDLSVAFFKVANSLHKLGKLKSARKQFENVQSVLSTMIDQKQLLHFAQPAYQQMSQRIAAIDFKELAIGELKKITDLADIPQKITLLEIRAIEFSEEKSARYGDAAEAAKLLVDIESIDQNRLYNAACVLSLCAASIDIESASDDAKTKHEKWVQTALDALKQSIDKGWNDYDHIAKDSDLDAIRNRSEFKSMIEKAKNKKILPC